jgi:hypothetical protein
MMLSLNCLIEVSQQRHSPNFLLSTDGITLAE